MRDRFASNPFGRPEDKIAPYATRQCLDADPAALAGPRQVRALVNEVLRHDSVVQTSMPRFVLMDLTLGPERVAKGDKVFVSVAGANRDPARRGPPSFSSVRWPAPSVRLCPALRPVATRPPLERGSVE